MVQIEEKTKLEIIGSTELVGIAGVKNIPAKIDTGADISAVWASDIDMEANGTLTFSLFGVSSPLYTGKKIHTTQYKVTQVRSSHGDKQIRYRVKLPLILGDKTIETTFTLANRSRNSFPVLIGRRTIEGEFLVDVSKTSVDRKKLTNSPRLNQELQSDPYKFHQKYFNRKEDR